jgi:hypothetical protein
MLTANYTDGEIKNQNISCTNIYLLSILKKKNNGNFDNSILLIFILIFFIDFLNKAF